MIRYTSTYFVPVVRVFLLAMFMLSLIWCGDAECLTGESHDNCASLVCSLLNNRGSSDEDMSPSSSKDCCCVCSTLTATTTTAVFSYYPPVAQSHFEPVVSMPLFPARIIDHPPLA
jgi:hypothetical protein